MWEQIRSNEIRSAILVAALGALLLLIGYTIGVAFFDNGLAGLIGAILVWVALNLVAFFQGDQIMLAISHARKVSHDENPQLYNVVEEIKIASGLPKMPDIYIVDDPAPNAFATGRSPNHAAITVTTGLLDMMNREELQGVIAHEMSHIVNRDVLLMSLAGVLLGTIVILSWYATRIAFFGGVRGGRRDNGGGGGLGQGIIVIIGLILIILAPIFARLIYFAISRRREYLADASGALYTRYPEGLASALEKIAASTYQVKSANQATAPIYTVNPFRRKGEAAADLTNTHPSITDRIRVLRAMAGNSSFADYNQAYQSLHPGSKPVLPPSVGKK